MVDLEHVLGSKLGATPEEERFVVSMQGTWKDARRIGRDEGRDEGRAEGEARALLTVLRGRGIVVPDAARERILAENDRRRSSAGSNGRASSPRSRTCSTSRAARPDVTVPPNKGLQPTGAPRLKPKALGRRWWAKEGQWDEPMFGTRRAQQERRRTDDSD